MKYVVKEAYRELFRQCSIYYYLKQRLYGTTRHEYYRACSALTAHGFARKRWVSLLNDFLLWRVNVPLVTSSSTKLCPLLVEMYLIAGKKHRSVDFLISFISEDFVNIWNYRHFRGKMEYKASVVNLDSLSQTYVLPTLQHLYIWPL